jgi:hypothetical protein
MGRNGRRTAKFKFSTYKIEAYEPTQGQLAALAMTSSRLDADAVHDEKTARRAGVSLDRLFRVLESLIVNRTTWEAMDDALVTGEVDIKEFTDLFSAIQSHDWEGEEQKKADLAKAMQEKTSGD